MAVNNAKDFTWLWYVVPESVGFGNKLTTKDLSFSFEIHLDLFESYGIRHSFFIIDGE